MTIKVAIFFHTQLRSHSKFITIHSREVTDFNAFFVGSASHPKKKRINNGECWRARASDALRANDQFDTYLAYRATTNLAAFSTGGGYSWEWVLNAFGRRGLQRRSIDDLHHWRKVWKGLDVCSFSIDFHFWNSPNSIFIALEWSFRTLSKRFPDFQRTQIDDKFRLASCPIVALRGGVSYTLGIKLKTT